jgi:aminoglycoside phosphotransferase (APT) family kinase protein
MTSPPWTPEREVTTDLAAELIAAQFPELRGAGIQPVATGWDNTVYLVGGRWVFRFPRRQVAVGCTAREIDALPRLAALLPLPVPVPVFAGVASGRYPWPFWGARLLPGVELAESGLADDARVAAAAAVGGFLRVLHDPVLASRFEVPLPADPNGRNDAPARARWAGEILDRLAGTRAWQPDPDVLDLVDRAGRIEPSAVRAGETGQGAVLCHGDLNIRHLLVDPDGLACGVIDWGDLCLADPAIDLSLAYCGFAGQARAALLSAYGAAPEPARELRARVLAVFLSAALAEYAAAEGRTGLLTESLAGLRRAVSD